jgi:hypothetical protein
MARKSFVLMVMGAVIFFLCSVSSADVPSMINYQGKLITATGGCFNGTVSMTFTIYSDDQGTVVDWTETQAEVVVQEGVFSVLLGSVVSIPALVFDGNIKYLGVQVEDDPEMRPLKLMVSVAYAYRAGTADAGIGGWVDDGTVVRLETSTDYVGIGTTDPQGPLQVGGGTFIVTANNDVGIGTTEPSEKLDVVGNISVSGKATIGPNTNTGAFAFVAGSGSAVTGDYSTVGGGQNNMATHYHATVSGGEDNWALQDYSTIGGGAGNNIHEGAFSTIGGGVSNVANGDTSTIGGGHHNDALGALSTVGGGDNNIASGRHSTVPGGLLNTALGDYSFAAGRRAKANHDGAFVWGDATDADFASTAANQFLIRASGGVGIGTTNPNSMLSVGGDGDPLYGAFVNNSSTAAGATGLYAQMASPSGSWRGYAVRGDITVTESGGYHYGVRGDAYSEESLDDSRTYGVYGRAGNATNGWNYGVYGDLSGSNNGAAICGVDNIGTAGLTSAIPGTFAGYFHGDVYASGNVGIGTDDPAAKLHVTGGALHINTDQVGGYYSRIDGNEIIGGMIGPPGTHHLHIKPGDNSSNLLLAEDGGNVGIGTTNPQGALDVNSTTGAFIVPRMTTAQRDALTPVNGMIIYNTTTNQFNFYENGAWVTK